MSDFRDVLERHLTRPVHRYVDTIRNHVADLGSMLNSPAMIDQFPGRQQPFIFSRMYGPIPLTATRRTDVSISPGFETLATVANPGAFILPREGSVKVGRMGSFVWEATAINTYVSWTWNADVFSTLGVHTHAFTKAGDIFDSVVNDNGGALLANNNRFVDLGLGVGPEDGAPDCINTSFEIGLYDKLRGRYLHDGDRLPSQMFSGQNIANRNVGEPIRFDPNSDIEPRLYVNEVRIRDTINSATLFNAVQFRAYVTIVFDGHLEQTDKRAGGY